MILTLSPREFLTIRAALRCWMNELGYHTLDELRTHYPELVTHTPMTADEVDAFLKNRMEGRP